MCIRDSIDRMGKEHKHYRKQWTGENLDLVMAEFKESAVADEVNKTEGATANEDSTGGGDAS